MTINITPEVAIAALEAAVAKRGKSYVYPQDDTGACHYVRDAAPSCLIGQVLFDLGVPLERLVKADTQGAGGDSLDALGLLRDLQAEGAITLSGNVGRALSAAQTQQDNMGAWGSALERAKEWL